MIYLLVSDDSLFHRMVSETFLQEEEVWSWAGRKKNGEAWSGPGAAFYGDPGDPDTFREVVPGRDAVAVVCFCLLYTSPSPRDRTRSRMPSSA